MSAPMIYRVTETRELLWFSPDGTAPADHQLDAAFAVDDGEPTYAMREEPNGALYGERSRVLIHHPGREEITTAQAVERVRAAGVRRPTNRERHPYEVQIEEMAASLREARARIEELEAERESATRKRIAEPTNRPIVIDLVDGVATVVPPRGIEVVSR